MSAIADILGDEVTVVIGGSPAVLRPTLRAGIEAFAICGDFATLFRKVADLDTTACGKLLAAGLGESATSYPPAALAELEAALPELLDFAAILASGGKRPSFDDDADPSKTPFAYDEHFARLFRIATGWLGWTPTAALDAPMAAIVTARNGRLDLLRTIFGGAAKERNNVPLDEKVRAIMGLAGTVKAAA